MSSQRPSRVLCLWPGLAGLWLHGRPGSLFVAAVFALLLNTALASTFLWPDLFGPTFRLVAWPCLVASWCLAFLVSSRLPEMMGESGPVRRAVDDTLFILAQNEYLKGNWDECLRVLRSQLGDHPRDPESRLMLATALRRAGRDAEAREQLAIFRKLDESQQWSEEVARELRLLDEGASLPSDSGNGLAGEPGTEAEPDPHQARLDKAA